MTTAGPAAAAVEAALARIAAHDAAVGAYTALFEDRARADAAALDAGGSPSARPCALYGLPVAVKALCDVEGAPADYGSDVLDGRVAGRDATVVARLRAAGAVPVGLTRTHEFAWGITTQHATRGSTRNPWDLDRVPGGSSGGSAAAVAAGTVRLAVGTDTGGSVRIPAAWCGTFGLKTTFGAIDRGGICPLADGLDTVGFLADSVALLQAAWAATADRPPAGDAPAMPAGLRFAVPPGLGPAATEPDRAAALARVVTALERHGATRVDDLDTPDGRDLYDTFSTVQLFEAFRAHTEVLGTWPRLADRYGPDVRHRLGLAAAVTPAQYAAARERQARSRAGLLEAFRRADILVSLVGGGPSRADDPDHVRTRSGERIPLRQAVMPTTVPQNLAGLPSVTVPAGADDDGLPVGLQLTGAPGTEGLLLAVAAALEAGGTVRFEVAPAFRP